MKSKRETLSLFFVCKKGKSAPEGALFLEKEKEKVEKRDNSYLMQHASARLAANLFGNGQKTGIGLLFTGTITIVNRSTRCITSKLCLCKTGQKTCKFHHKIRPFAVFFYCPYDTPESCKLQRLTCTKYIKYKRKFYALFTNKML